MFRIWKFNSAPKAYWAHGSTIKFKQSTNNSSINSCYQRDNNICIISSHNYKNWSGENSSEKRRCNNKKCFNLLNFESDNFGLKVGVVGTVHYILNNWDFLRKEDFCPVQNFKYFAKYLVDHVILTTNFYNGFTCKLNVIPKSSSVLNIASKNNQEFNIKGFASLDNIHIDFDDTPEIKIDVDIHKDEIEQLYKDYNDQFKNTSKTIEFKKLVASNKERANDPKDFTKILLDLQCELANNAAVKLANKGKYKESIKVWNIILKKNPTFVQANFNLALCYQEGFGVTKNLTKACNFYEASIPLGHMKSYYNLALILLNQSSICNDKDTELRAIWLLNVASENGLSNASDALICLSLAKDETLNIGSHFPENTENEIEHEKIYNWQLQPSQNVSNSFSLPKTAINAMSTRNSITNQHHGLNDENNLIIFNDLNEISKNSVSQLSNDIQFTDSDDDEIDTFIQKRKKYRLRLCVDTTALRSWIVH